MNVSIDISQRVGRVGKDIAGESAEESQDRSDCTVCMDEWPDFDGVVSQDGQGSSSNGRTQDVCDQQRENTWIVGRMGRWRGCSRKQAELIGQYEAEENAQREWENKFSENRDYLACPGLLLP
jgi:hypothetical protein